MSFEVPEFEGGEGLTSQEYVYMRLRNAIMVGAIPTGASLTMRGLADVMGLSATPIREALRRLNSEQAVEAQDNRRMLIPEMNSGRFEDLVSTRLVLECHAGLRALPYISDIVIGELRVIDDEMDAAISRRDYDRMICLNHKFHRALYGANPDLTSLPLIESIWLQLGPFQRELISDVGEFYVMDDHKAILEALMDRAPEALTLAIENDIQNGLVSAGRALIERRAQR